MKFHIFFQILLHLFQLTQNAKFRWISVELNSWGAHQSSERELFCLLSLLLCWSLLPPPLSMLELSNVHNLYVEWFPVKNKNKSIGYDFPVNEIFIHFLNWWVLLCVKCFIIFSSSEVWFDDVDPEDLEQVTGKRIQLTSKDVDSTCNETLVTGDIEGLVFWYLSLLLFDLTQK